MKTNFRSGSWQPKKTLQGIAWILEAHTISWRYSSPSILSVRIYPCTGKPPRLSLASQACLFQVLVDQKRLLTPLGCLTPVSVSNYLGTANPQAQTRVPLHAYIDLSIYRHLDLQPNIALVSRNSSIVDRRVQFLPL